MIRVCYCSVKDYYTFLKCVLNLCVVISVLEVGNHLYSELLGRGILCPFQMHFLFKNSEFAAASVTAASSLPSIFLY